MSNKKVIERWKAENSLILTSKDPKALLAAMPKSFSNSDKIAVLKDGLSFWKVVEYDTYHGVDRLWRSGVDIYFRENLNSLDLEILKKHDRVEEICRNYNQEIRQLSN